MSGCQEPPEQCDSGEPAEEAGLVARGEASGKALTVAEGSLELLEEFRVVSNGRTSCPAARPSMTTAARGLPDHPCLPGSAGDPDPTWPGGSEPWLQPVHSEEGHSQVTVLDAGRTEGWGHLTEAAHWSQRVGAGQTLFREEGDGMTGGVASKTLN